MRGARPKRVASSRSCSASGTASPVTRARQILATVSNKMPCADSCKRARTKACDQASNRWRILARTPGQASGTMASVRYCSNRSNTRRAMGSAGRSCWCKARSLKRRRSATPSAAPRKEARSSAGVAPIARLSCAHGWLALAPAGEPAPGLLLSLAGATAACGCKCGAKLGKSVWPCQSLRPR